jgi:hypothetical protein
VRSIRKEIDVRKSHRRVDRARRDPRIVYPCYKSLDEFIDVERLKSLDGYITERIEKHMKAGDEEKFYTGTATMDVRAPKRPGSRVIHLTQTTREADYYELNDPDLWVRSKEAEEFSLLMDCIDTLPFKKTARMLIMYDDSGNAVPAHRDHTRMGVCHEFVWFRTNLTKPFYMFNHKTKTKRYVESYSAWFDTCNQFHGVDAGKPALSFSLRVDGIFSDEFRARIPVPEYNRASTSALWARIGDKA